jgi:GntR family transcriptional regulator/MocR family aminotransferase
MLRSWNLKLELSETSGLAIYMQIAQKIIEEIQLGRLPSATAMPGTRDLAASLDVNRKTVVLAYAELVAQGWLSTEARRGTFVSANLPNFSLLAGGLYRRPVDLHLPAPALQAPVDKHEERPAVHNMIEFNEGTPDTRLIPFEVLSRAFRHGLAISSRS